MYPASNFPSRPASLDCVLPFCICPRLRAQTSKDTRPSGAQTKTQLVCHVYCVRALIANTTRRPQPGALRPRYGAPLRFGGCAVCAFNGAGSLPAGTDLSVSDDLEP